MNIEAAYASLESRYQSVERRLERHEARMDALTGMVHNDLRRLDVSIAELVTRFDTLADRLIEEETITTDHGGVLDALQQHKARVTGAIAAIVAVSSGIGAALAWVGDQVWFGG